MKFADLDDDQYDIFIEHFRWYWKTRMDYERVSFRDIVDELDDCLKEFTFEAKTIGELAKKFFDEYADDLFQYIVEKREHAEDLEETDAYNARYYR